MAIQFITDSASDILPQEAAALGITLIPLIVTIDGTEYRDAVDLSHAEFYEKLATCKALPTTSQISPARYAEEMERITANGDTAIVLVLSSALSGTYQSACIAAADFPGKVWVVDTLSVTVGQRLLVQRALKFRDEGCSEQEIVDRLNSEKEQVKIIAALETLEYLKKGGRISAATAFAGELLSIKPVVTVKDGAVVLCGKARGSKNGGNLLRKMITDGGGIDFSRPFCLAYSGTTDQNLQRYIADHADLWDDGSRQLPVTTVGCTIGTHVGPGAIAVAYFEK